MLRVRTVMTGVAGSPWYTNMYFGGADAQSDVDAATDRVRAFWQSIGGYISTGVNIDVQSDVALINEGTGVVFDLKTHVTAPVASSGATERLPTSNQALVRLGTSGIVAGRRVRGRIFLPGFNEGVSVNGQVQASDRALIDNAAKALAGITPSATPPMVVWSRPVDGGRAGSFYPVTSCTTWSQWAVLRSRRD